MVVVAYKIKVEGTDQLNCYFALGSSAKRAWFLSLSRHGTFRSLGQADRGLRHRFADIYISGFGNRQYRLFDALCRSAPSGSLRIGKRPLEVAATVGAKPMDAFFNVVLPLAKPGFVTAALLTFAHTIGEFGVVLMIGGNVPGKTQVVSTEIYSYVEAMEYSKAHWLAGGMVVFSFFVLLGLTLLNRHNERVMP